MNLDLAFDELLPHPVEVVWGALTDADAISDWLMATTDFTPQVGARFRMKTQRLAAGGWVDAEVLELDPPRRMVWAWSVDADAQWTTVTFELTPQANGTRLKLSHVGEIDPIVGALLRDGWPGRLELLRSSLDRRSRGGVRAVQRRNDK
jgi:uncharacterized protein YndB with AHSA1/START domain